MFRPILFFFIGLMCGLSVFGNVDNLMPKPKSVVVKPGNGFALNRGVHVDSLAMLSELQRFAREAGLTPDVDASAHIIVGLGEVPGSYDYDLAGYPCEAYRLRVSADTIDILAPTKWGVIRAAQTLQQLVADNTELIPCLEITDWPAFKLRGFMHDVGRSFIPLEELKREIDLLSRFKVNTFHWHFTDNTGWRFEVESYPQLTSDRAITRFCGQYYTQAQVHDLQEFAAERGVVLIPEIDLPGHSAPFERVMGHSMQTAEGMAELKTILKEVVAVFDKSPYIHIGGDEIGFSDSYLIEMIDYVHSLGKKAVIWNRYNRPPKVVDPKSIPCDMTTNWATSGVLSPGIPNVDMRYNYTNHFDVFADVAGIFKSNIFGITQGNPDVAGTISAAWNDTMTPSWTDIVRQNNIYANILASSERAWVGGGEKYIEEGGTTLPYSGSEFDEFEDWERRFLYHKSTTLKETAELIPYVRQCNVCWNITDQMPNGGDPDLKLPPEDYIDAEKMPDCFTVEGSRYGVQQARGAGIYLRHIWHPIVKGFYPEPQKGVTAYAWTFVYSPVEQDAGALIEFYTYSRSGNEKGPRQGAWDRRGSRIWLNGVEIEPPAWVQPDADIRQDQNDSGLSNENFTARNPVKVHLRKGWNKVFLKLPHADNGGTARDKWQFAFVVTDLSGLNALEGVEYNPNP